MSLHVRSLPTPCGASSREPHSDPAGFRQSAGGPYRRTWIGSMPPSRFAPASPSGLSCRSGSRRSAIASIPTRTPKSMPHPRPHPNSDAAGATRAVQEENAIDDEQFWEAMRDIGVSTAEGYKHLIASTEMKLKETGRRLPSSGESRGCEGAPCETQTR